MKLQEVAETPDTHTVYELRQMPDSYCWQGVYGFCPQGWDEHNVERPMRPVRVLKWDPGQRIVPVLYGDTGEISSVAVSALWREINYTGRTNAHVKAFTP